MTDVTTDAKKESLDFALVWDRLGSLYQAVHNKLEREWPVSLDPTEALPVLLRGFVLLSANTLKSIGYLCADHPPDANRRPEYALSVPPLARTLMDTLFNIVFLFENPSENIRWYWRSAWREYREDRDRYKERYGDDPRWSEWLETFEKTLEGFREPWFVEAGTDAKDVRYWPHPGQMLRCSELSEDRRAFLQYLNDWFYKDLSRSSHLSGPGFILRSFTLFEYPENPKREENLVHLKGSSVFTVVTLFLAILSEIEGAVRFGLAPRMEYLWGLLKAHSEEALDLYEKRYSKLLQKPPN